MKFIQKKSWKAKTESDNMKILKKSPVTFGESPRQLISQLRADIPKLNVVAQRSKELKVTAFFIVRVGHAKKRRLATLWSMKIYPYLVQTLDSTAAVRSCVLPGWQVYLQAAEVTLIAEGTAGSLKMQADPMKSSLLPC